MTLHAASVFRSTPIAGTRTTRRIARDGSRSAVAMNIKDRLRTLEKIRRFTPERFRPVAGPCFGTVDLANCRCIRYWGTNGRIMEIIELDGCADSLPQEELDRWNESQPIKSRSSALGPVRRKEHRDAS